MNGAVIPPATAEIANTGVITIRFHGRKMKKRSVYLYHAMLNGLIKSLSRFKFPKKNAATTPIPTKKLMTGSSPRNIKNTRIKSKN